MILFDNSFKSDLVKGISWCRNFVIKVLAANSLLIDVNIFASIISSPECSKILVNLKNRPEALSTLINISTKLLNLLLQPTIKSSLLFLSINSDCHLKVAVLFLLK